MGRLCWAPLLIGAVWLPCDLGVAQSPVEFIPSRAPLVFALDDPVGLLTTAESLPVDRLRDEVPAVRLAMLAPQLLAARGGLMWAEGQLGVGWREMLEVAAGDGLVLAVERENSLVLVTRSPQPQRLPGLVRAVAQLVAGQKVGRDAPAPQPSGSYRGVDAYQVGELVLATAGDSLLLASNAELAKATIDRLLDGGEPGAWRNLPAAELASVRMLLRHAAIPMIEDLIDQASKPNPDFGQELLFGGVLASLASEGETTAVLQLADTGLSMNWSTLRQPAGDQVDSPAATDTSDALAALATDLPASTRIRSLINGFADLPADNNDSPSPALQLPTLPAGAIAQLSFDRDLAMLWAEKDLLLSEQAAAELDVADSQLSTAFGGFDFGDEVLGAINPTLRLIVLPAANAQSKPPVLPEAVLLGSLRVDNPAQVARRFRIAWQTVIGILNVERGGNGQPQLELETQNQNGLKMMTGRYSLADAEELNADAVDLYASLAPTIATSANRLVIATSDSLAKKAIQADSLQPQTGEGGILSLALDGSALAELLTLNRPALLAQNMLEKGNPKELAEREIDTLIEAARFLKLAAVRAVMQPQGFRAVASLRWDQAEPEAGNLQSPAASKE